MGPVLLICTTSLLYLCHLYSLIIQNPSILRCIFQINFDCSKFHVSCAEKEWLCGKVWAQCSRLVVYFDLKETPMAANLIYRVSTTVNNIYEPLSTAFDSNKAPTTTDLAAHQYREGEGHWVATSSRRFSGAWSSRSRWDADLSGFQSSVPSC